MVGLRTVVLSFVFVLISNPSFAEEEFPQEPPAPVEEHRYEPWLDEKTALLLNIDFFGIPTSDILDAAVLSFHREERSAFRVVAWECMIFLKKDRVNLPAGTRIAFSKNPESRTRITSILHRGGERTEAIEFTFDEESAGHTMTCDEGEAVTDIEGNVRRENRAPSEEKLNLLLALNGASLSRR